jgi:protein-S-isoprenylcysteine O-methyltransferase Ste14
MRIKDALVGNGRFLFRWRSLLPLLLLPALALALRESAQLNQVMGEELETLWAWICFLVALVGLAIRCYTIGYTPRGTSGRGTRHLRADRLNTTGIYSIVRNPLYLGNAIIALGLVLAIKVWWLAAIVALAGLLYLERIVAAEEEFLAERFGVEYSRWVERTPAFIPRPSLWRPSELPFSWRTVLRREYHGLLVITASFFVIDAFTDLVVTRMPLDEWARSDYMWALLLSLSLIVSGVLRVIKKHTRWLHERGR